MSKIYSCSVEKEIIAKIAKDLGTTKEQVLQIADFQRKILRETMEKGTFEGVRFAHLGKFFVNPKRLKMLNNRKYHELIQGKGGKNINSSRDTKD